MSGKQEKKSRKKLQKYYGKIASDIAPKVITEYLYTIRNKYTLKQRLAVVWFILRPKFLNKKVSK